MNIALITLEGGGISTVCYGLADNLAKKNIHTTVFTETSKKHKTSIVSDSLTIDRLHRFELPPRFFWFQFQNFGYLLNKYRDFDIIHGVYADASSLVSFYKKRMKIPYVVSFHAEPLANAQHFLKTPLSAWTPQDFTHQVVELPWLSYNVKRCSEQADHVVLVSYSALEEFRAAYKNLDFDKVSVIHNAVNLQKIDEVKVDQDGSGKNGVLSVVCAGRLVWVKGLMCLLKAFELGKSGFKNVELHLYGRGPEEGKLRNFVSSAGLDDIVRFHGRIPNKQLIVELKKADVVVAPSFHEAQSMFVLEAMACRKPVVAFDIPSMKEIITDGENGLLAKSFDVANLSEKLRIALSDTKLRRRLGEKAYNHIREEHNWDKQVQKYLEIYSYLS